MCDSATEKAIALYRMLDLEWGERRDLAGGLHVRLDPELENFVVRGRDFEAVLEIWGDDIYELAWLNDAEDTAERHFEAWWRRHGPDIPHQPAPAPRHTFPRFSLVA